MSKTVTVGIIAYQSDRVLRACLDSVLKQTYEPLAVAVLNNHSPDAADEWLAREYPQVKLVKSPENVGFARGHNRIFREFPGDYYLCLNPDVVLEPDFTARLVALLERHPQAATAGGKVLRLNPADTSKTHVIDTVGLRILPWQQVFDVGAGELGHGLYDGEREVFGVSGAVFLIRPAAMTEAGGFDERMFMYKEDVDLIYRLRWLGYEAWVDAGAVAYHERTAKPGAVTRHVRAMSLVHHRLMLKKNASPAFPLYVRVLTWVYERLKDVYTLFTNPGALREWRALAPMVEAAPKKAEAKAIVRWMHF